MDRYTPTQTVDDICADIEARLGSGGGDGGDGTDPEEPVPGGPPANRSQTFVADLTPSSAPDQTLTSVHPEQWSLVPTAGSQLTNPSIPRLSPQGEVVFTTGNVGEDGKWAVLHNPGPAEGGLLRFEVQNASADEYQNAYLVLRGNDADSLFFIRLQLRARGSRANAFLEGLVRQGGKTTSLGVVNVASPEGEWLPLASRFDEETGLLHLSLYSRSTGPQVVTYDLNPYLPLGTSFGWCAQGPYGSTPPSIRTRAISHIVPAGVLSVTSAQKRTKTLTSAASGTWARLRPTYVQHILLDPSTREAVTPWATAPSQVVGADGTWTTPVTAPTPGHYLLQVRMYNDTGTLSEVVPGAMYFGVDRVDAEIGHNMRSANYYEPHPILNNWGKFVTVGQSRVYAPYASINGLHRITTNPEAGRINQFASVGTGRVVSTDGSTGQHVIEITADQGGGDKHRYLDFTGAVTRLSVSTDGAVGEISQLWLDNMEGVGLRDLNMTGTNDVPIDTPLRRNLDSDLNFQRGDFDGAYLPVELICRGVSAKHAQKPSFKYWWHVDAADLLDARIREEAVYIRDTLPSSMWWVDELTNESWNFKNNERRWFTLSLRLGLYGAGTYENPQPPITASVKWLGEGGANNGASPATPAGGLVGFNRYGVGYCVWRAKVDVPEGADIEANQYWEVGYSIVDIANGARMGRAHEHMRRIGIRREVFGASYNSRIRPVLMGQAIDGVRLDDQLSLELSMPGYLEELWGLGWGWYIYDRGVDYNATNHTVESIEAAYRSDIPFMIARTEAAWEACQRLGKTLALYEGLRHPSLYSTSDSQYKRTQDAFWASDRGRLFVRDAVVAIRRHAPGLVMQYDALSTYYWGLRTTYADTANPGYVGWHQGLEAPLA